MLFHRGCAYIRKRCDKDPLLLQEGIGLLDGSLHGECELLEGKLHIILSADDPLWYYVLAQIQVADKDIIFHAGRDPLKECGLQRHAV